MTQNVFGEAGQRSSAAGGPTVDIKPWWVRHPDRWQRELTELAALGVNVHEPGTKPLPPALLDSTQFRLGGGITQDPADPQAAESTGPAQDPNEARWLWFWLPAGHPLTRGSRAADEMLLILITYPNSYPWFPPSVEELSGALGWAKRHAHDTRTLCLLHAERWRVDSTAAALLLLQLPLLLKVDDPARRATISEVDLKQMEEPAVAPVWPAVGYDWGSTILVDSSWRLAEGESAGVLRVDFDQDPVAASDLGVGSVTELHVDKGRPALTMSLRRPRASWSCFGRWVRLQRRPETIDPAALFAVYFSKPVEVSTDDERAVSNESTARQLHRLRRLQGRLEMLGLILDDPGEFPAGPPLRWLFVVRTRSDRRRRWTYHLVRTGYGGADDLSARSPASSQLKTRRVVLVGAGAIGSAVATHLAKAGLGRLVLIDGELLEAGNLSRHHASSDYIGLDKAGALTATLADNAPLCRVTGLPLVLGTPHQSADHLIMTRGAASCDLLIDAAANPAVARYLAALARSVGTPLINVSATAGAWGGVVVLLTGRDGDGCWACLEHYRADGTLPVPPADPAGIAAIFPTGCAEATFSGAVADLDTVSAHASRMATAVLAGADVEPSGSRVDTATLRESSTGRIQPVFWKSVALGRHPQCKAHRPS